MVAKVDFNNNRRDGFADSNYISQGDWNNYISLAKTRVVDWFPILSTLPYMYYFSSFSLIPAPKDLNCTPCQGHFELV